MPVINRIADFAEEMRGWRRALHRIPELSLDCPETAAFIAARLREIGVDEIHEGLARTGIVAIVEGQRAGPTIGLRADFDALPIAEETGAAYASERAGRMHACGHDGHTAMLLGAAKYLAETRRFSGRVALIFQPGEEDGGGAGVMVEEGVMDRFGIAQVYAIHNLPNSPFGQFTTTPGPMMAAVDTLRVDITGRGGHGAQPHDCIDPIPAAIGMIAAFQSIVTRNADPQHELVISVTEFHAGTASNIIPETAWIGATIRCFDPALRKLVKRRIEEIVAGQAAAYGVRAGIFYDWGYPAMVNHAAQTGFAADVAREISGEAGVVADAPRAMVAEDFAYMLQARPGAYLMLGTGPGAGLHHPAFDFNDEAAPIGASFFARLVERAQPLALA